MTVSLPAIDLPNRIIDGRANRTRRAVDASAADTFSRNSTAPSAANTGLRRAGSIAGRERRPEALRQKRTAKLPAAGC
jgi:hypothetical protein